MNPGFSFATFSFRHLWYEKSVSVPSVRTTQKHRTSLNLSCLLICVFKHATIINCKVSTSQRSCSTQTDLPRADYLDEINAAAYLFMGLGVILQQITHFLLILGGQMSIICVSPVLKNSDQIREIILVALIKICEEMQDDCDAQRMLTS